LAVKLLMTWDILPGREQEYFEFVVRDFIPGIQKIGLEPTDAWFTVYGDKPQIMTAAKMRNLKNLYQAIESDEWERLINELMDFVENYDQKIVLARTGFQI